MAASDTSRALVGSSHSSSFGGTIVARARATRWRCPPESWPAWPSRPRRGRPTRASASATFRRPLPARPGCAAARRRAADGQPRGQRRAGVLEDHLRAVAVASSSCPSIGVCSPATTRSRVDLPQPLSPTSATDSPRAIVEVDPAQGLQPCCRDADLDRKLLDMLHAQHRVGASARDAGRRLRRSRLGRDRAASSCRLPGRAGTRTVPRTDGRRLGHGARARVGGDVAARAERAAGAGRGGLGRVAGQRDELAGAVGLQREPGAQQAAGVRVGGRLQDLGGRPDLGKAPGVHDGDAVGDLGGDAEVVGDHQDAAADLFAQAAEQLEDLRLHGHVQCRGRLVGDDQLGSAGDRHRDHDALAQPARELVREDRMRRLRVRDADEARAGARPPVRCPPPRRPGARSAWSGSATSSGPGTPRPGARRRTPGGRRRGCATMSAPATVAVPLIVVRAPSRPSRDRPSTLLPDPDSPTRPRISPGRMLRLTSCNA